MNCPADQPAEHVERLHRLEREQRKLLYEAFALGLESSLAYTSAKRVLDEVEAVRREAIRDPE